MRFNQYIKKIKNANYLSIFLLFLFIIFIFYGNLLKTWFQQDEWYLLGKYTYLNSSRSVPIIGAFLWNFFPDPRFAFNPLYDAVFALLVKLWGVNFTPYAILSLLLHTTNAFLVFVFVRKLTKNIGVSWFASIIFATSAIGQKAITWIATSVNTQGAATLSLVTLLIFQKFIETQKLKWFFLIFPTLLASLWFKETAVPMYFIIIAFSLLFAGSRKRNKSFHIQVISFITVFFMFFFIARILLSVYGARVHQDYVKLPRLLTPNEYVEVVGFAPVRALVDPFVLPNTLYLLGNKYTSIFATHYKEGTIEFGRFAESTGIYRATALLLIPILAFLYITYKLIPRNASAFRRTYFFALVIQLSVIVIALLLTVRGTLSLASMLRSRDLYFPTIGSSIILALFFVLLWKKIKPYWSKIIFVLTLGFFMFYHWMYINDIEFAREVKRAEVRKPIVEAIYSHYPALPKKIIFYTESDTPFYGSAIPSMPFQTGFGRTLLVWYSLKNNDRPTQFMKDDFLYLPNSQGYREVNSFGFGYFSDFQELRKTIKEFNLKPNNIIAFSYKGETNHITDITSTVREKLK